MSLFGKIIGKVKEFVTSKPKVTEAPPPPPPRQHFHVKGQRHRHTHMVYQSSAKHTGGGHKRKKSFRSVLNDNHLRPGANGGAYQLKLT